jgi:hypothetical protein
MCNNSNNKVIKRINGGDVMKILIVIVCVMWQ